jgi:RNA polymerase sigma-70 factor (ECF subfamily)
VQLAVPGRAGRRARRPAGDPGDELVRRLYHEHGSVLLGYVTRLTGDRQLAEDVVQETLVRAWRNRDQMTQEFGSVRGWLVTVAKNIVTDQWRARAARPREVEAPPADRPGGADPAEEVTNALLVAEGLRALSADHREALVEVYLRGRSMAEAAQVLDVPAGTVKSRVHYALRSLRSQFGGIQDGAS